MKRTSASASHARHMRSQIAHFSFATGEGTDHHIVRSGFTWTRRNVRLPKRLLALGRETTMTHVSKPHEGNKKRVPLTITLSPEQYAFIEACAKSRAFTSLDQLFEAAITIFETHKETLHAYLLEREALGMTRDEAIRNMECAIVYRPRRSSTPRRASERKSKSTRVRARTKETHGKRG
jgi:hypothetical protein